MPLKVKLEEHDNYNTISIHWPNIPKYNFERAEEGFLVKFYDDNQLDISEILKVYPSSKTWHADDITYLVIGASPNVKFESAVNGTTTTFNVYTELQSGGYKIEPKTDGKMPLTKEEIQQKERANILQALTKAIDTLNNKAVEEDETQLKKDDSQNPIVYDVLYDGVGKNKGILFKAATKPAAIFDDGEETFVVFRDVESLSIDPVLEKDFSVSLTKGKRGVMYQFKTPRQTRSHIHKDSSKGWKVLFKTLPPLGPHPINFSKGEGDSVSFPKEGLQKPIKIGAYVIFTTFENGRYVPYDWNNLDYWSLVTSAGVVLKSKPDRVLKFGESSENFFIKNIGNSLGDPSMRMESLFKIDEWKKYELNFFSKKQKFSQLLLTEKDVEGPRFELIYLYLTQTMGEEALLHLRKMSSEKVGFSETDECKMFLGLCYLFEDKTEGALKHFFDIASTSLEGQFWAWVAASRLGEADINPQYIQFLKETVVNYPSSLRSLVFFSVAENLINNGYFQFVISSLEGMSDETLKVHLMDRKKLLLAMALLKDDERKGEAIGYLNQLKNDIDDPSVQVDALISLIGDKPPTVSAEAQPIIRELQSYISLIEGSPQQLKLLGFIAKLQSLVGDYFDLLQTYALIQRNFPEDFLSYHISLRELTGRMIESNYFEKVGFVKTVQILQEFISSAPVVKEYVDLLLSSAEKLHYIGLSEEALGMLNKFAERKDIKIADKEQFYIQHVLAKIYIDLKDMKSALKHIAIAEKQEVGDLEKMKLKVLRGSMAVAEGKREEGARHVQSVPTYEARKLRLRQYWELMDWDSAAVVLEEILASPQDIKSQSKKEGYVVQLATVYVLQEKVAQNKQKATEITRQKVRDLYKKYEKEVEKYKGFFQYLIEGDLPHSKSGYKKVIESELEEVGRLRNFLDTINKIGDPQK